MICFDLALDGEHGDEHDEPFGIIKGATARAVSFRLRKLSDAQKFAELAFELFDPFRI